MFTVSREWFCFDAMMESNPRINLKTYDGIQFIKELVADPTEKEYDVINVDVYDSCEIISFFESEEFFEMVLHLWTNWDARPRLLVMNAYYPGHTDPTETTAFRNAVKVFGAKQVESHSAVILSVTFVPPGEEPEIPILAICIVVCIVTCQLLVNWCRHAFCTKMKKC